MDDQVTIEDKRLERFQPEVKEGIIAMHEIYINQKPDWTLEQSIQSFLEYREIQKAKGIEMPM